MANLIELKTQKILVSSSILKYDKPDYVYIPLLNDLDLKALNNTHVLIGDYITSSAISPVSGIITGIKKMNSLAGNINHLEIKNDYKEMYTNEYTGKKLMSTFTKEEFESRIPEFLINEFNNKDNLVINCIDDEPFVLTENFYLLKYTEEILEFIDKLSKIYHFNSITICVKSTSSENINRLINILGSTPNIHLEVCPNLYLLGNSVFLLKHLNLNESNTLVLSAHKCYNLLYEVERKRYLSSKLITISGDAVKNPTIVSAKIGAKIKEIIAEHIKLNNEEVVYFANGLMHGKRTFIEDFIVTEDLDSLIIMKEVAREKPQDCLNCGACISVCPVGINPILLNSKDYFKIVKDKCLNCGLCSYICPANINFKEIIERKEENA